MTLTKTVKALATRLTCLCLLLPLTACALSGQAIQGHVLEEGTHKPIPGAIVIVRWVGSVSKIVDAQNVCVHVESTLTDAQGRYHTPAWSAPSTVGPSFMVSDLEPSMTAYHPGYTFATIPSEKDTVWLKPFVGSRGERLKYLESFTGMQCGKREDYAKQLIPLYRAIYEEARRIAETQEDKHAVNNRLRDLEEMELGYEKSWENWRVRERDLK